MTEPVPPTETHPQRDASPSRPPGADAATSSPSTVALAAVLGAGQAGIAADAIDGDRPDHPALKPTVPARGSTRVRRPRAPRRAKRLGRRAQATAAAAVTASAAPALATTGAAAPGPSPDTHAELRDWIKDNATLLSNASLLISISAIALNLLPEAGVLDPYIKALVFGAALLLLIEMHHQWPADLQLHSLRTRSRPQNHSWRMTAFALIMPASWIWWRQSGARPQTSGSHSRFPSARAS